MPLRGLRSILDKPRADSTMVALPVTLPSVWISPIFASCAAPYLLADRRTVPRDLVLMSACTSEWEAPQARTLHCEQTRSPAGSLCSGILQ
jgi:hypothetical protein